MRSIWYCLRAFAQVTKKPFNFPAKHNIPLEFSSAADGTNVVQVNSVAALLCHADVMTESPNLLHCVFLSWHAALLICVQC